MNFSFRQDSYSEICSICGEAQLFIRNSHLIRETYHCSYCRSSLREREHAKVILEHLKFTDVRYIKDLILKAEFRDLRIWEPGTIGSIRRFLRGQSNYYQSAYSEDPVEITKLKTNGFSIQNLEFTTWQSAYFDLVITSDIFEHIRFPLKAFSEIHRVLKPGGAHIFTIPLQDPLPSETVSRVDTSGPHDIFILPPEFHGNGRGGKSLVYTDFGEDLPRLLSQIGFESALVRGSNQSEEGNNLYTIYSIKLKT
jgi:SAM-dependent methyltransferase